MDPDALARTMRDPLTPLSERISAANWLLKWLNAGGKAHKRPGYVKTTREEALNDVKLTLSSLKQLRVESSRR